MKPKEGLQPARGGGRILSAGWRTLALAALWLGAGAVPAAANSIVFWGTNSAVANVPPNLTNAVALAAGVLHSLALLADGSVVSWGTQTNVPAAATNVVAISAGGNASLALRADGTLVSWGQSSYGQTNVPAAATNVVAISVGSSHTLALRQDGTVVAWGTNNYGQINVPAAATNLMCVSAGGAHSVALRRDGKVFCWGSDTQWQVSNLPANLTNVANVAAGGAHSLALHKDGSHSYWGVYVNTASPPYSNAPTAFTNVGSLSAGSLHTTSLLFDGMVHTDGFPAATNQPTGLSNVTSVVASQGTVVFFPMFNLGFVGQAYSLALAGDGSINVPSTGQQHRLTPGAFRILSPRATGVPPLHYEWRLNGTNIPGATDAQFVIPSANRRSAGIYSVVISNSSHVITSEVAQVVVPVRQRLMPGGAGPDGFVVLSGDEDGGALTAADVGRFAMEASADGTQWSALSTVPSLTNGLLRFADADGLTASNRLYRVRENP